MATIYLPTDKQNGKTKKIKKWYVRYRNQEGLLEKVPGFTNQSESSFDRRTFVVEVEEGAAWTNSGSCHHANC